MAKTTFSFTVDHPTYSMRGHLLTTTMVSEFLATVVWTLLALAVSRGHINAGLILLIVGFVMNWLLHMFNTSVIITSVQDSVEGQTKELKAHVDQRLGFPGPEKEES